MRHEASPRLRGSALRPLRRSPPCWSRKHLWLLARIDAEGVALLDRRGRDWAARLPRLVRLLRNIPVWRAMLVGELSLTPGPGRLRRALSAGREERLVYRLHQVADVNGVATAELAPSERRRLLRRMAAACRADRADGPRVVVWRGAAGEDASGG